MPDKVLVVEDDLTLRETLEYNLAHQGYKVCTATNGPAALEVTRRETPDLIVLAIMLSGLDGFEVCRILRQEMTAPILMLTARDDEIDKVVGLEVGADDYMTKPFSMRELLARVKAMLRRVRLVREELSAEGKPSEEEKLAIGDLAINLARHSCCSSVRWPYTPSLSISVYPRIALRGARNSWEAMETKVDFMRSTSASWVKSRKTATLPITSPESRCTGAALTESVLSSQGILMPE